ncbi:MAG: diguanylate cyclase [Candidatus Obscuribacterales bacterium]|nr:diguanylate cyclase [Candidatus Obscuribacterales bacterium]
MKDPIDIMLLIVTVVLAGVCIAVLKTKRNLVRKHQREVAESHESLESVKQQLEDAKKRLDELATIDPLTDLSNWRGLERILIAEINRAKRTGSPMVGLLLDCDDFGRINDTLGHAVGDVVLKEMVQRITTTLRPSDHVARIGGDQFAILLTETAFAEALLIAERVRLCVAESPIRSSNDNIFMTASLGVAPLPYELSSVEELLSMMRHALKLSKSTGKNRVSTGEQAGIVDNGGVNPKKDMEIVQMLRQGDCFRSVKHAMYRLADEKKVGYELLSRGPAGAFEMPYDFFRVAIENNILSRVDLRCLKACIDLAGKLEPGSRFDVNLFPSTMLDTPIETLVALFPEDKSIGTFCVEISEQQFIGDPSYLKEHTLAFKKAGILVGIDDVGFGRSSLESLILLEPDVVKVDIKYVAGIAVDSQKQRLLRRLVKVVQALGAELVAEGVESREDLEVVRDMGVQYAQGYLWGYPN